MLTNLNLRQRSVYDTAWPVAREAAFKRIDAGDNCVHECCEGIWLKLRH